MHSINVSTSKLTICFRVKSKEYQVKNRSLSVVFIRVFLTRLEVFVSHESEHCPCHCHNNSNEGERNSCWSTGLSCGEG